MELLTIIHFILIGIESIFLISNLSIKIKIKCKAKAKAKIEEKIKKLNDKLGNLINKKNEKK